MIDEKTQAQLRAKYNPEGSMLRQHQLRMLEMLKYFDDLCQKHGIRYWLSSGNCIGVARHGGFIPWDDDIDVEMLREDYLKLEKVFKETDDYVLQTWKNDPGYFAPYAKMRDKHSYIEEYGQDNLYKYRGVYIDVFQLERAPRFICKAYHWIAWKILFPLCSSKNNKKKQIYKYIKKLYFHSITIFRILFSWFPKNKLRHTYGAGWVDNTRHIEEIYPLQRVKFEDIEINVPNNLDLYLQNIYGDYMKLPPENKIPKPHIQKLDLFLHMTSLHSTNSRNIK